jgi:hypothetical protein
MNRDHFFSSEIAQEFLKDILKKTAQEQQNRIPKQTTVFTPEQITSIAKTFAQNLSNSDNQMSFVSEKPDAELSVKHLISLDALLNFLSFNGIQINGLKLVLPHASSALTGAVAGDAEFAQLSPEQQKLYFQFPYGGGTFQYYVYHDGLVNYLQVLKARSEENDPGAIVLRPYILSLLEAVKSQMSISIPAAASLDKNKTTQQPQSSSLSSPDAQKQNQNDIIPASYKSGEPLSNEQMQSLEPITNKYPFLDDRIDFRYIDQWLSSFLQIMSKFKGANAMTQSGTVAQEYVKVILGWGIDQQSLSDTATNIYQTVKNIAQIKGLEPNATMAFPSQYLQTTIKCLSFLQNALLSFKSIYYPGMPSADEKDSLDEQVGNGGSSLAAMNIRTVQQWLNNLPAAQKQIESR